MATYYLMAFSLLLLFCGYIWAKTNGEDFFKILHFRIWVDKKEDKINLEIQWLTNYFTLSGILTLIAAIVSGFLRL